jgi:DNA repair protein RadC
MQVSELKLTYRSKVRAADRPLCCNSEMGHRILRQWWDPDSIELIEEFYVVLLDRQHRAMGIYRASQGGTTGTIADPRLIFGVALKARADGLILAHNHPSGNLRPSAADKQLTNNLTRAGRLLQLQVNDHLILAPHGGYYSFADNGLIGEEA